MNEDVKAELKAAYAICQREGHIRSGEQIPLADPKDSCARCGTHYRLRDGVAVDECCGGSGL